MDSIDWLRRFLILAHDGTDFRVIKCSTTGELYAILQGDYEGTLTTVKLDSEGRISAFVVDSADVWENINTVGNAELAARLGSPVTYHRAGDVVFLHTFVNGLPPFESYTSGTGASVALDGTCFVSDGLSVKLTGGSNASCYAGVRAILGMVPVSTMGFAARIALPGDFDAIQSNMLFYDGETEHKGTIWLDKTNSKIAYRDSDDNKTNAHNWTPYTDSMPHWGNFKWTINFTTEKYGRVWWNDRSYGLTTYGIRASANASNPYLKFNFMLYSRNGQNDYVWLDDIVLTVNEPT